MIAFGVIGAGNIARTFCEAVNGIGGHLYAVASRDIDKAKDYQKTYGFDKAYANYESLLEDPFVDCVYIATPHGLHYEHMMLALDYGKHILCEKAFTLNEKQAKAVLDKAKVKGRFVMEALWTRFLPTVKEVLTLVQDGLIGDIIKVEANFCFKATLGDENRLFAPHLGGGALLDVGIYPLTFADLFLGTPENIESTVDLYHTGVDLSSDIKLTYPHATAHLKASLGYNIPIEGFIYGSKGYIHMPGFFAAQHALIYNRDNELIKEIKHPHMVNGMEYEILETINCILNHQLESPLMTHDKTLEMMRLMDTLRNQWSLKYPQE
ncbi:MAG: Gfo/Idh/MocA family protein [Acholeplasmataceae bacterium]